MLRYLFADMNSYFASVEQQELGLSGPVAVVPMANVDTTCVIAASSEAKVYGVGTGTAVHEARKLCPTIKLIEARPQLYVEYHHRIVEAIESCLHVDHVTSIDEMYGRLMGDECSPDRAAIIAYQVKAAIRKAAGLRVRCSIGLAPNAWLAKLASDMQKPDGLTMILAEQMPEAIYRLKLTDLPGIASGMERRLNRLGIEHVYQLCGLTEPQLAAAWGSKVLGSIWWHQLRGMDLPYRPTQRRTVGHSHVLPPPWRTDQRAQAVLARMIHKAAARMRRLGYWAGRMTIYVEHLGGTDWEPMPADAVVDHVPQEGMDGLSPEQSAGLALEFNYRIRRAALPRLQYKHRPRPFSYLLPMSGGAPVLPIDEFNLTPFEQAAGNDIANSLRGFKDRQFHVVEMEKNRRESLRWPTCWRETPPISQRGCLGLWRYGRWPTVLQFHVSRGADSHSPPFEEGGSRRADPAAGAAGARTPSACA